MKSPYIITGGNPIQIANTMVTLESYFVARRNDPDKMYPFQTRIDPPTGDHNPQTRRPDRRPQRR